jgi:ankyrin repeat protein
MLRILFLFTYLFVSILLSQSNSEDFDDLLDACDRGDVKTVKTVLSNGVKINGKAESGKLAGKTPLMVASSKGKREIVKLLIENGADLNIRDEGKGSSKRQNFEGWTALHYAADADQDQVVKILVQNGADVNIRTKNGLSAMQIARLWQNEDMIRILKNAGAEE